MIAERTNGDLFEIVPETAYSVVYQETVSRHQEERRTDARPAIASQVEDMDGYTTIFLGFPLWSADAPMVIRTFMESYDLSGKTVVPFATSGGSGMSTAQSTVETFCPDSHVLKSKSKKERYHPAPDDCDFSRCRCGNVGPHPSGYERPPQ